MNDQIKIPLIETGVRNLDEILNGGLIKRSVTVIGGTPGAGKTIISQQIAFKNATIEKPVLFFQTLSEPTPKTLTYLRQFDYFDETKIGKSVHFCDLGDLLRSQGLKEAIEMFLKQMKEIKPALVVVDSFKVFSDLAKDKEDLRKFSYEIAIQLLVWECTALLLGEFDEHDLRTNPLSSIVDGIIMMSNQTVSGENQRIFQVLKMRGTNHSRDKYPFSISNGGVEIYAPRLTITQNPESEVGPTDLMRHKIAVSSLDALVPDGVPSGSSIMVSGVSGTGKTLLSLEMIYRGATELNEKGLYVSFEETPSKLCAAALAFGWDLRAEIKKGMIEIICIPQSEVLVERDLLRVHDRIKAFNPKRVVIDSISVFMQKITELQGIREKFFQFATLVHTFNCLGFFISDIPFGKNQISRFGVEETVVDGIFILSAIEERSGRKRYLEVYKLRNSIYKSGKQPVIISDHGVTILKTKVKRSKQK